MKYPGLGIIGCEKLAGIYGLNEGIIDGKGVGVRHLFYDGFDLDLIHSAVTLIKDGKNIYYGNRIESKSGHPTHIKPVESFTERGFIFKDVFETNSFRKVDSAFGFNESSLGFSCEITNLLNEPREIEVYSYVLLRQQNNMKVYNKDQAVIAEGDHSSIAIKASNCNLVKIVEEGPTGFIYRLTSALLYDETHTGPVEPLNDSLVGVLLGKKVMLNADGKISFDWNICFEKDRQHLETTMDNLDSAESQAINYWENFISKGNKIDLKGNIHQERINRIAIKSAMIGGFVPADLTGHYYSDGMPSYYARDSMMVARAFLLSGHYLEAKEIILYLKKRVKKVSGEFYQRYNGLGIPSEGANNNVHHQLDSIGYFVRNIRDYYIKTGELLVKESEIISLMNVLLNSKIKNGLVGPEGGVNEGVFGPAYITSSNMFIYGGVESAMELLQDHNIVKELVVMNEKILEGVESTFIKGEGYKYGYVNYHNDLIKKYDTPQYFGLLYGFKDTDNMRRTHEFLVKNAAFFEDGIGYSEQEYHHGPWLFNTGACAQYAYCIGDEITYLKKVNWMSNHGNDYGLMPEAISGDDEKLSYINPLIWACAEYVSTCHIKNQEK